MNACAPAARAAVVLIERRHREHRHAFAELLAQSQARAASDHEIDDRQVDRLLLATTRSASAIARTTWTS